MSLSVKALAPDSSASESSPTAVVKALYDAHFRTVWRILRRSSVPEASLDDAVQDVFLVVHRRRVEFDMSTSPKALLAGIALRVAADHRRSARRRGPVEPLSEALLDETPTPSESASTTDRLRLAQAALNTLDEPKRAVLILAELEGLTAPEIAQALETKLNTVYSRLRAARLEFSKAVARIEAGL